MRGRSTSVYTKRPAIPISTQSGSEPELPPPLPLKKAYSADAYSSLFEDFGPMTTEKVKETFSGDFSNSTRNSLQSITTVESSCQYLLQCSLYDDILDETERSQRFCRSMVIGSKGSGKRSLLHSMFPEEEKLLNLKTQAFDLVTKTVEKVDSTERYHFWVKETATEGDNMTDHLVQVYYQTCSLFFVVYETGDKASFEGLDSELKKVYEANSNKDVTVVLVGNKKGEQNKVSHGDVCSLKKKYNIQISLEIDVSNEIPVELRSLVECFLR